MQREIIDIIQRALNEDMPKGDITTDNLIPEHHQSKAYFIAKEDGIISGVEVVEEVFKAVGGRFTLSFDVQSGDAIRNKQILGTVEGDTKTILKAERVSLNLIQRMSGIATTTHSYVEKLYGTCKILDTRKTTPNLRILEKQAVKDGGGTNHRYCLSDMVMIKDNHIDAVGSITKAVALAKEKTKDVQIEVEVETYKQFLEALNTECDIIMLDNMSNELMLKCVLKNDHLKKLEASGNMNLDRIEEVSKLGVDFISVGALTHSVKSLDISLKFHTSKTMNYVEEIRKLKKEKNAVILAHYYQEKEIQDIADYLGDSLNLARIAMNTDSDIIVFCGVHFMAETAKILNPSKKVLLPVMKAGCLMADMITPTALQKYKDEHPNTKIITYVNSSASVKALSDCICTSTNAIKIINHYLNQGDSILYCPDQNLGKYAMKQGGVSFDVWDGCCPIHHFLDSKKIIELKEKYPAAKVLAHPECQESVIKLADYVGSTKQLLDYTMHSQESTFIIATEKGVIHAMERACPNKTFILASPSLSCSHMKYTTLKEVYEVLKNETNEIFVDDTISKNAKRALDEMLKLS